MPNPPTLTIRLSQPDGTTYHLDLTSPDVGERSGTFTPPYIIEAKSREVHEALAIFRTKPDGGE